MTCVMNGSEWSVGGMEAQARGHGAHRLIPDAPALPGAQLGGPLSPCSWTTPTAAPATEVGEEVAALKDKLKAGTPGNPGAGLPWGCSWHSGW